MITDRDHGPGRSLLAAVFLISTAAIAYEILLIRLMSIVQWHHFAWMVISLALLGYGVSGTVLALGRRWLVARFEFVFTASALSFSVTAIAAFALGQHIPFNALEVAWSIAQWGYLAALFGIYILPFFFAAAAIGLAMACRHHAVSRIYSADLLGAGAGAILVIALLFTLRPEQALVAIAAFPLCASAVMNRRSVTGRQPAALLLGLLQIAWLLGLLSLIPEGRLELRMSEYKGLSQALRVIDSRKLEESSSPLGLLTVVGSPTVPFRHAPGLSFNAGQLPPEQFAVFSDGDSISAISRWEGDPASAAWLGDVSAALPYRLKESPSVLVLGAGAGADVLMALHHGASRVDAVELNPGMVSLLNGPYRDFSGNLFEHERVKLHLDEARGYLARTARRYDIIQLSLSDSFGASGSGVQSLNEDHLYTVEAMVRYLDRLEPGGMLSITRWLKVPPRDSLKLAATLIEALKRTGAADPERRLVLIRSWNTFTLLARNGRFEAAELAAVRGFSRARAFDVAWYPGMAAEEANRFNRLDRAWLHEGVKALLGPEADSFKAAYKFRLEPATDDRPYFFHFFRWRVLPEVLQLRERGGAGLIEWSYLLLVSTLVMAGFAGALLILLPLALKGRKNSPGAARFTLYFFLLGLAFLFVEMAFIQKFILFLNHPLYSVAVVLAGFLLFAGLGSAAAPRIARRFEDRGSSPVTMAAWCISVLGLGYLAVFPRLGELLITWPDPLRVACSLALIAPLAFFMGLPFPLGLRRLSRESTGFIPWAWGINGFASVIAAPLAVLLALGSGFTFVLVAALGLYAIAAAVFPGKGIPRPG